jgi:CubicO group peptidase (beta-lactamase class C family)
VGEPTHSFERHGDRRVTDIDLDRLLSGAVRERDLIGVGVAIVAGDTTVATSTAGVSDLASGTGMSADGACNWFSMTKIATATAAMMLAERGRLDLDAPVRHYLGDIWPARFAPARVRHLLSHSSGLRNPLPIRWVHGAGEPRPEPRAWLTRLLARQRAPRFEPGTRAAYTNVGYLALGEVIATAAGRSYESFVTDEILRPLGMTHTAFAWNDLPAQTPRVGGHQRLPSILTPALGRLLPRTLIGSRTGKFVALGSFELDGAAYGGLIGSVIDAARLVALHCNDGTVGETSLLSARSVDAMATITTRGKPYDLGLGWFRPHNDHGPRVEHFGGGMGFWNILRIDAKAGRGVAVMSNITRHWEITTLADEALASAAATGT